MEEFDFLKEAPAWEPELPTQDWDPDASYDQWGESRSARRLSGGRKGQSRPTRAKASAAKAQVSRKAGRRVRVKYSNKTKVLLCYFLCWALALLIPFSGLLLIYPYKLVGTAPAVADNLFTALPALQVWLGDVLPSTAVTPGMSSTALAAMLATRDLQWQVIVAATVAVCWVLSLMAQLTWRGMYRHPLQTAKSTRRAIHGFHVALLAVLLMNALGAALLFFLGVRFISGKTVWDWLVYGNGFVLNVLAAWVCFRWAAPPAISGKHGFFKRL